jgi:beta-glucosidase
LGELSYKKQDNRKNIIIFALSKLRKLNIIKTMEYYHFRRVLIATVFAMTTAVSTQAQSYPTRLMSHESEIEAIIKGMTLEEKIAMLHGKNMFSSAGIPRLGIADIEYADGPFGIREEMEPHSWNSLHLTTDSATFFPTGSALAATWSTEWAYAYGRGMSREARLRGKDMILGPAMNIQRIPTGGRTYEYLSEDPLLSGALAVAYTRGAQEDGTAVCLKHYALNNQENYRGFVDVRIPERAMYEIYLRPFEMAVREADAWGIMAAYNKVNGRWCSENEQLLNTILRQQWGFPGMVISDWGGVHSTVDAVTAGMNVEMPGDRYMGKALLDSVRAGKVSEDIINQRVREILRVRMTVKPITKEKANTRPVGNAEEMAVALNVARRSVVLLKNEQLLPIDPQRVRHIAVIGENAVTRMALGGVGAGVKTRQEITPLEGLQQALGNRVKISYVQGYKSYSRQDRDKRQSPQQKADPRLLAQAVKAAKKADLVIFLAGDNREVETEGSDRKSITLPSGQDELAAALAKANNRLVTVIVSGGPVDVSTVKEVSGALLASWFNGSMGGQALAEILTGKISPSGKLPMSWPRQLSDVPAYVTKSYPQEFKNDSQGDIFVGLVNNKSNQRTQQLVADYAEEDLVGYRWYECKEAPVAYPFGYGLSYAQFEYSDIKVTATAEGLDVRFTLTNTSATDAEEVAQVYAARPLSHIMRPVKELKGFKRIGLKAGERKEVTIPVRRSDLCHWDENAHTWMLEPGKIIIQVGGSSDNLPLSLSTEIN